MRLTAKTAIVTGGASGFGAGIARRFASEGASVVIADISDLEGESLANEIQDTGGTAIYVHTDVTSRSDTRLMIERAMDHTGHLDILINNAGFSHSNKPFTDVTDEEFDRVYNVNVKAIFIGVLKPSGLLRADRTSQLPKNIKERFTKTEDDKEQFVLVWAEDSGRNEDIVLTQHDIRQLQLAKGAIVSGVMMLQNVLHVPNEKLEEVMLCGGFGNYINIESALKIKLLPNLELKTISYLGNAAHLGAQIALLSEEERNRAQKIAGEIRHVALATHPDFQDIFVDALKFD